MKQVRKAIDASALKLRRLGWIHRPLRWFRQVFLRGCQEASLEFLRWTLPEESSFGPPRKYFSVYQALRTGVPKTTGRIVLEDQGCPKVTENSLMVTGGYEQYKEQPWPIFWSLHSNIHLVTQSLALMLEPKQICLESVHGDLRLRHDPAFRFLTLPAPVELRGNWTSIVSRFVPAEEQVVSYPNYTHWLLEALPRLALLAEFPADTKIIIPSRLHKNQEEALRLMNIFDRCRPTSERHLKVENYYFSSLTTMLQGYSPYGIDFLRRTFLPKRDQSYHGPKKFYIQRLGLMREPANRLDIERLFAELGWEPIDIMKLNFAQQIQLFAEAESITGMFGSAFTNSVFCNPRCKVFDIMPFDYGVDGFLEWIAQVVGHELHQMVVPGSYDYRFGVDLQAVKAELAACGMIQP